jgi:hypothetical protein
MGKLTTCLFGGALLSAGLASTASADELVFPDNINPACFLAATFQGAITFNPGPGFWDDSRMSGDGSARTRGQRKFLRLEATAQVDDVAYAIHNFATDFEVIADTTATVSWDTSGDVDGPGGDFIDTRLIIQDSELNVIVDTSSLGVSGSTQIDLVAGETYTFRGAAVAGTNVPNPGGSCFVELAMPPCEGDLDGDGDVDVFDFAILASDFGCGTQ